VPPPFLYPNGAPEALSYCDLAPLKATLERLVDFDLINAGEMRFSVGAVNVRTRNFVYFDSTTHQIGPAHVMASEEDVIKHVMLKDTVDGEFTTTADVAAAVLFLAGFETNALTGQSLVVSHGWFME
jgi:NAD(P)-dependent dehydrogenase (short-subunit alcohol dehydrogenase family)